MQDTKYSREHTPVNAQLILPARYLERILYQREMRISWICHLVYVIFGEDTHNQLIYKIHNRIR